nr:unnamed protein product [Callosobruchus analis]
MISFTILSVLLYKEQAAQLCKTPNVSSFKENIRTHENAGIIHTTIIESCSVIQSLEKSRILMEKVQNYKNLIETLQRKNWEDVYTTKDVNEGFKTFLDISRYYIDDLFPLKIVQTKKRHNKPWLTT